MIFDLETLSPWADLHRMLTNMNKMRVVVGGKVYEHGEVDVSRSEDGIVTFELLKPVRK